MNVWESITHFNPDFKPYGGEHLYGVIFSLIFGIFIILLAKKHSPKIQQIIFITICMIITSSVLFWAGIEVFYGRFELEKDIPFVFCNFIATFLPLYALTRNKVLFNIIYYLVVVGAIQAIITPSLKFNFPHYESLKFWAVHSGLLIVVFYSIFIFRYRPTLRGLFKTYVYCQIYMLVVILINYLLDWNYLYLKRKPEVATLLDLLGDWPYYVIFMDLLLIPYFLISYVPFHNWNRDKSIKNM